MLDLYSGTGSVSKVFQDRGYEIVTVDIDPKYEPSIQIDTLVWDYKKSLPVFFDVIACSPPCTEFSQAMTRRTRELDYADSLVQKALEIVHYLQPKFWYIENPQTGLLKGRPYMKGLCYVDVDYCCFSDCGYEKEHDSGVVPPWDSSRACYVTDTPVPICNCMWTECGVTSNA